MAAPNELIYRLSKRYFAMNPIYNYKSMISDYVSSNPDFENQNMLLQQTLQHPISVAFPPSLTYKTAFLKELVKQLECSTNDVADELYEAFTECLTVAESDELCYKTYFLPYEKPVTMKESRCLISGGTTGLCTWQAAMALTEWLIENTDQTQGRDILELGSGLGFTGISACKLCAPKSYTFTDCHASVLQQLKYNIVLNLKPEIQETVFTEEEFWEATRDDEGWQLKDTELDIKVLKLDWESVTIQHLALSHGLILAADVVYDMSVIPALVNMLGCLLDGERHCYLASTIRNIETYNYFKESLKSAGLRYNTVEKNTMDYLVYDRTVPIELIKIKK